MTATRLGAGVLALTPLRRTIAIGRPTGSELSPDWPLVCDVAERFYFRPEGPNVLLSPADETPSEPCDARPEEIDVALGMERVNAATTLDIRSIITAWSGLRTFSVDRNPVVGFDPTVAGLFWLAGQGGFGSKRPLPLPDWRRRSCRKCRHTDLMEAGLDLGSELDPARLATDTNGGPLHSRRTY